MRPASRSSTAYGPDHGRDRRVHDADTQNAPPSALRTPAAEEREPRSGYGTVPGAEFPRFVYVSVLAAFAWIMLASWVAFAGETDASLALGIAVVLAVVFFALPVIIRHVAISFVHPRPEMQHEFLDGPVEIATGHLKGGSAWLQVLIIPLALALAATLIGGAHLMVR